MSIVYARGKMLYTDVKVIGIRRRVSTGFRVGQEAQAMVVAARLQAGEIVKPQLEEFKPAGATLADAIKASWETWRKLKDQKMKRLHADAVVDYFKADTPVTDIDETRIQQWVNVLDAGGNASATINRKLALLSGVLRLHAVRTRGYRMPQISRLREAPVQRGYLTLEQVQALVDKSDPEYQPLFIVLRDTGCRISEAMGLQWSQVGAGTVTFVDTKAGDTRTIPLTTAAAAALQSRRGAPGTGPFPWSYKMVRARFKAACKAAEIVLPEGTAVHLMRHSAATQLIEQGAGIRDVQVWLGHHCVQTTEVYAKVTGSRLCAIRDMVQGGGAKRDEQGPDTPVPA